MSIKIQFKLNHPDAQIPTRGTSHSAGFDLYALQDEVIHGHSSALIDTGIIMGIPEGFCGVIKPRSGKSIEYKILVLAGLIDADYREHNVKVGLMNCGDKTWHIKKGERFAQIVFHQMLTDYELIEVMPTLGDRTGGFGSTGL